MITANPTDFEMHLFHEGNLYKSYQLFGSHIVKEKKQIVTRFCVWAPHALEVRVVGSFNDWKSMDDYVMEKQNENGVWSLVVPTNLEGHMYKYEILTSKGEVILKADPYAFFAETRPHTASVVYNLDGYKWLDGSWRQRKRRRKPIYERPLNIYEFHFGSWKKKEDGEFYTYTELADEIIPYVLEHGFTHIELLPLLEHPFDRSWGYQGTGYYAATSRYGSPHDLMVFIDKCHEHDIGVLLDWVPGHFCKDAHGLYMFDGKPTYEYKETKDRENYVWGTANFDLGKKEVQSFLISNALFWMEYYHIDGFRVDAVANILYWANSQPLAKNPYAVNFLQKLNQAVFAKNPAILMIAEDSTDWPKVTGAVHEGGLGFNYKWNMGWMNDTLKYMEANPFDRKHLHNKVTFSLLYAYTENFILPLSHDEVVHGKKSLLNKMPGTYEEKFAQLRLLYGYFMTHPGKKLLFMGGEFGQFDEWKDLTQLDWDISGYDAHQKMNAYTKGLFDFYKTEKALHEIDHHHDGFEWIDVNNTEQSIFSYIRKGKKESDRLIVICNFQNIDYDRYKVGVPFDMDYVEVFNSDDAKFGGTNQMNQTTLKVTEEACHGKPYNIELVIPAFGVTILRPMKKRKESKVR